MTAVTPAEAIGLAFCSRGRSGNIDDVSLKLPRGAGRSYCHEACPLSLRSAPTTMSRCGTIRVGIEDGRLKKKPLADAPGVMTAKRKAKQSKRHEYYLKRRATMTPEQLAAERAYQREYERKRRAVMTPEELAADNAYKRKYHPKRQASMTPKELDAIRAYRREYARKRRATMTPKQLDAQRKYQREYHRKWREK